LTVDPICSRIAARKIASPASKHLRVEIGCENPEHAVYARQVGPVLI
jgi:hypothetical protein